MQKENQENSFMCEQCYRKFDTWRGLRVHQGKVCLKKRRQCRSSDCKTRSKSSQDENHSGAISASVDSPFTLSQQEMEQQTEPGLRKPRILWPAANEKAKYKTLEEEVQKKLKEVKKSSNRGDAKEILSAFATIIYDSAIKEFGICEGKKKTEKKSGLSRRQRVLAQLRKQKRDLQKQKKYAPPEEIEGLRILFEDLKKKSRDLQRHERRCTRRKERKREREQFLKNPYEAAKKLFTEARSGKLECTKEELDAYVKQTYSDSRREEPLPYMRGLKRPAAPVVKYYLGPIREKEVDEFVKQARAKSAPGGDGVSYKVFKYCDTLRHTLFEMLRGLWKDKEIVKDWCRAEGVYLPKEQNAKEIGQFRPISIINVTCKIFMGILTKRTVAYLQSNGYVDETVQKAGVPGIPGCIEHAFTIWDTIQEAKKNKESLNVV
ncbi:uncharacterized protein LOC106011905 [Aplysia californica]|uniref:Uncharacterized protein LOC106011905 n=1 Tax=Aplysia californica TaxID=6500 RepID=A0ABM1A0V4_APLCA|nr:uncharacterized protein LOC106011905 [Aplysia californica]